MTPEDRIKRLGSIDESTPTEDEWMEFRFKAHRSVRRRRLAGLASGVALVAVVAVSAYAMTNAPDNDGPGPGIAGSPTPSEAETPTSSPTTPPEDVESVALQQWFVEDEKLALSYGQFEKSQTPATDAMESLLTGVPGPLAESGVETAIPEGVELVDISISDGTASVTLGHDFSSASSTEQLLANGQIVYTLTQFPTVQDVSIMWGEPGGVSTDNEGRRAYEDLLPAIVVERPYAGETVDRTFTLSGIANVFEANVSWRLVDADGNVLQEGFTTATCGTGCWGTFEEEITYKGDPDYAILEVFQSSAEDGSPMNMVEIPLNIRG